MVELTVDQSEAFDDQPHMRSGGLGCARRQLQGRRPEAFAKRRGVDPADAVLLQHPRQRHLANPLAGARRRQAPPQVQRPRRRDVAVNRIEELRVVAPELSRIRFPRRTRSRVRSSLRRDHSRSSTIAGSVDSSRRKQCGSVRSAEASTRASRRSSFAPAGERRSRKRSSCFGLIEWTAKPRSIRLSTTGPRGVSIATPTATATPCAKGQQPVRHLRQSSAAVLEQPLAEHLPGGIEHARLVFLRSPVDTDEPRQFQINPPVCCRIERARPDACRSLYWRSTAQTSHGASIGGWTAGAQVLFRCSMHWDPSVLPVACRHRETLRGVIGKGYRDPPVSSVCCQLLTSFLDRSAERTFECGRWFRAGRWCWSCRSGYPRETERPGWAGRCDRRRTGEGVPSSDHPSAAEGSSGARGGGGDDGHRWLRQARL